MKKLSSAAIITPDKSGRTSAIQECAPDSIRGAVVPPSAPHPLCCHSARAESSNKKVIGVFECLVCHEEFQLEISKAEIDDRQHCPFCDCLGELNHMITVREK